jgi:hypothetical protein
MGPPRWETARSAAELPPLHRPVLSGDTTYAGSSSSVLTQKILTLTSIAIAPQGVSIPVGATQQFTATGTFSDGSSGNITTSATWTSSATTVATVSTAGVATAVDEGPTTIQAAVGTINSSASLTGTPSRFRITGSLINPRDSHTATTLQSGKVLITGGGGVHSSLIAASELYDPATGTFAGSGNLMVPRFNHTATLLNNGMVFIAGGQGSDGMGGFKALATAELFDPATGTFSLTGSLNKAKTHHTATLLSNGKVLVVGGNGLGSDPGSAELYDPSTGLFSTTRSLNTPRDTHTATLLNDGTVLIAGGENSLPVVAVELYDPATGIFTTTGSLSTARVGHTAALLNSGKVLIVGGYNPSQNIAKTEIYDPATKTFTASGSLNNPREFFTSTALGTGQVLVVGGVDSNNNLLGGELYDPTAGTFSLAGNLNDPRVSHTAALLNNGMVLIAGGNGIGALWVSPAETYQSAATEPPPLSLKITPATVNMAIGGTQKFTAVDNYGYPRLDVIWTVSDPSLATVTSDEDNAAIVTALAAGQVTLTANAEAVTAQEQVTILTPSSFVPGTTVWSAPLIPGFSPVQLAQAVPSTNGPDLYSIQTSGDGTQSIVQALMADGEQLWQTQLPVVNNNSVPDGYGGLLVTEYNTCTPGQTQPMTVVDLDAATARPLWQVASAGIQNGQQIQYCYTAATAPQMAVRGDGAVIIAEPTNAGLPSVTVVSGQNGATTTYSVTSSSITNSSGQTTYVQCCVGPPMVNSDAVAYVEYEVRTVVNNIITADSLYLFHINLDRSSGSTLLSSTTQNEALLPGPIIPDGQGGVLATRTISPSSPPVPQYPYQAADVSAGVVGTPYNLPFSPQTVTFEQSPTLVLGENGTAFASGTTSITINGGTISVDQVASFNLSSGATNWTYQATAQNSLSIIASAAGNGLVAKTTDQSAHDTLLWFNSAGAATMDTWNASHVQYADNQWFGLLTSAGTTSLAAISDAPVLWANSGWLMPQQAGTSAAEPAFTLMGRTDCEDPTGRHIDYWLVNTQGHSLVTDPYVVFEHQTDHSLAKPNGVSPLDYLGQKDKFTDWLSPLADSNSHVSTQTFNFGLAGQRLYPVRRIDRMLANSYAPVSAPEFSIVMNPGQQATLNGRHAPYVGPCSGTFPPN